MVQSGCPPCTEAYNILINACAAAGLEDRAWALLDEMKAGGPDKSGDGKCAPDIVTFNTMLKVCYAQPGELGLQFLLLGLVVIRSSNAMKIAPSESGVGDCVLRFGASNMMLKMCYAQPGKTLIPP